MIFIVEIGCICPKKNKLKYVVISLLDKSLTLCYIFYAALSGARIAEYSHLYDQVMFKDTSNSTGQTSASSHHFHPGLPSSPSMPETSLDDDWLHSIYSNGELVNFMSSSSGGTDAQKSTSSQHRLTHTTSIPSVKTTPPSTSQRWSSCISAPSEEEHVYSSIKRNSSFNAPSSKSSLSDQSESAGCLTSSQRENRQHPGVSCNRTDVDPITDRPRGPSLIRAGRQSSLPDQSTLRQPDLTLHDGQQVVVLNRTSALNTLNATQNYLANFKDNEEDDDDYVEIRSEDDSEVERDKLDQGTTGSSQASSVVQSRSLPCTPVHSCNPLRPLEHEHLEKYLWSEPQQNQPNIVQSLREKFQCLSSSSFA